MEHLLRRWFGGQTFSRAKNYANSGRVLAYHYDAKERVLTAAVKGSGRNHYSVEIDFAYSSFAEPVTAIGECTCPVGTGCKHICALLLSALKKDGEEQLRLWIFGPEKLDQTGEAAQLSVAHGPGSAQSANSKCSGGNGAFPSSEQKRTYERWLNWIKAIALTGHKGAGKSADESGKKPLTSGTRYILYVLNLDSHGQTTPRVTLHTSQTLKRGGHGALKPFQDLQRLGWDSRPPCSLEDRQLVQQMYGAGYLDPFASSYYGWHGTATTADLEEKSPEALLALARTGRLVLGQEQRTPVQLVDTVVPKLTWHEQENTLYCRTTTASGDPIHLVPTTPPLLIQVEKDRDPQTNRPVPIAKMGSVGGALPGEIVERMLKAPGIPKEMLPELRRELAPLPGFEEQNLPTIEDVRRVKPVPVLVLDGIPAASNMPVAVAARARLYFEYGQHRVDRLAPMDNLISDDGTRYPRNYQHEGADVGRLRQYAESATSKWSTEAAYREGDYCLGSLKAWKTSGNWLAFLQFMPQLEEDGWKVELDSSFPYDLVAVDDDDWFGEVEQSEAQDDWFGLKLGFEVDGERLDLLPLLVKQINQLPTLEELANMGDDLVPVAIGPQRFVTVPANRLRLLLVTLLELFGDRGTKLHKSQAPILDELGRGIGLNFSGGETLQALARKLKTFKRIKTIKPPKNFHAELRDYQSKGLAWLQFLRKMELGGILADDMGLGKTVQALAHIQLEKELSKRQSNSSETQPSLVIAPTSLMHNWRREAERFSPQLKVVLYHGADRKERFAEIRDSDLVLTTYALIQRDFENLRDQRWHILILDESQAIKNPRSKASLYVRELQANQRLCMTGTPVENNLAELWSQFDFLMPGFLGPRDRFNRCYRTPIERHGDNDRRRQLARRVAPFMLRRTKELVVKELPPKTEILRECELEGKQRDLYETVRSTMEKRVRQEVQKKGLAQSQIIILDALLKMRQACCDPQLVKVTQAENVKESAKMKLLCELLEELLAENRKILIFSQFTSMLALIEQELERRNVSFVKLTGNTTDRDKPVQRFQSGEVPVFLISLKAGGAGLNLTAADTVIHYDPWWNPAVEDQATDRAYRIGQDKPVFVYKLVASGTLEEKMLTLKERKKALAQGVYSGSGQKATSLTAKDLDVLFEPMDSV